MNQHEFPINRTYGLTLEQISRVSALSDYLEINQSEVVRLAIDKLYEEIKPQPRQPNPVNAMIADLRARLPQE